jgi:uracil-DNA glycosylase
MQPLSEIIAPDWAQALAPVEPTIHQMGDFLRAENAAGRGYLPAGKNVLRAFTYPLSRVKVLIVGQDPYPNPGHPVGLSFSVAPTVSPIPRSLVNIFQELHDDLGVATPTSGDLTPWCDRGVMLLNRVLTVTPGHPGSHRGKGWEHVTDHAIRTLAARHIPLVAILWGRPAQELRPLLGETPVVMSPHPSPFSRANELLVAQGADPIDWSLP